ncbi:MAG: hypothetical protein V3V67_04340 [Myxococcota bacterium]
MQREQLARRRRLRLGRPVQRAPQLAERSVHVGRRGDPAEPLPNSFPLRRLVVAQIDPRLRELRDDVALGASAERARVERDACGVVRERLDFHDLAREREHGAAALAVGASRVGREPVHDEVELTEAAPGAHHLAPRARALEDEAERGLAGLGLDARTRAERADLLVGVEQHAPLRAVEISALEKRAERVEHDDEPALHVRHAGPDGAAGIGRVQAVALKGGVGLEHRVVVPDEQKARPARRSRAPREDERTDRGAAAARIIDLVRRALDLEAERDQGADQTRGEGLEPGTVPGARVHADPALEQCCHLVLARREALADLVLRGVELGRARQGRRPRENQQQMRRQKPQFGHPREVARAIVP